MSISVRDRIRCRYVEGNDPRPVPRPRSGLVDAEMPPEAVRAAGAAALSMIEQIGRRAAGVFLEQENYEKIEHVENELMGKIMLECLRGFVHERGGHIALATRLGDHGEVVNPIQTSVKVAGEVRQFLRCGYLFIHFPGERVVISAEPCPLAGEERIAITVRSNMDPAAFWQRWREHGGRHAYLRGQAFFADGEIIERRREYRWDDILLPHETKEKIRTHVDRFLANRVRLKALGVKGRRGLILSGPPGTGKTLLGKVLADTLEASFVWVSPRHVREPQSFDGILSVARFVAPAVVFLEDLDLFAEDRDSNRWAGLGELMNQLDGAIDNEDLVTIATTNRLEVIEKALRNRPGRFDRIIRFEAMDDQCRRLMLTRLLRKAALSAADMDYLVEATEEYTGARIEELANTLYILAVEAENVRPDAGGDAAAPQVAASAENIVPINRTLIDTALEEVQVRRTQKIGFDVS